MQPRERCNPIHAEAVWVGCGALPDGRANAAVRRDAVPNVSLRMSLSCDMHRHEVAAALGPCKHFVIRTRHNERDGRK
jgi:hypothetical protein